jgi:Fe2+ transport system protein FeoA
VTPELPAFLPAPQRPEPPAAEDLVPLLAAAHRVWTSPEERRRVRSFGFRPAREPCVLKRDWHGVQARVSEARLVVRRPGGGEVVYRAEDGTLEHDGAPFVPVPESADLVEHLLSLIAAYERWVEAREGREGRLGRDHGVGPDRRPINALAETRRLQRLMHSAWRPPSRRR